MDQPQKSILITGCSSGIGFDAAHGLARAGYRVFATCRLEGDCERLRAEGLESFPLDYTSTTSIHEGLAEALRRTGGTLDALYNNGAYGLPAAVEDVPTDALREIFETNFFGWHELTRAVIPVMRAQGHGTIINCSSVLGFTAIKWRGAYAATKHALEGLTDVLRLELKGSGISVVLIEPGPISSDIRKKSIPRFEKWINWQASPLRADYEATLLKRLYSTSTKPDPFQKPASAVTAVLLKILATKRPKPRYFITLPTHVAGWARRLLSSRMRDWLATR